MGEINQAKQKFTFRSWVGKVSFTAMFLAVFFGMYYSKPVEAFAGGAGTSGDPYQITTAAELADLSSYLGSGNTSKYFKLMNNIDLNVSPYNSGTGWTPIGNNSSQFYGEFDGNGYTISNLFINRSSTDYQGLFGYINQGSVANLTMSNMNVNAKMWSGGMAGMVVQSDISDITLSGSVTATQYGGMLAGNIQSGVAAATFTSDITNITASGTMTGGTQVGGIVGRIYVSNGGALNFSSLASSVNVTGTSTLGGVIGETSSSVSTDRITVYNSFATGSVAATGSTAGGFIGTLAGWPQVSTTVTLIRNSYSTGNVSSGTSSNSAGGFAGFLRYAAELRDCYSRSAIPTANPSWVGGLVGQIESTYPKVNNSYATGLITSNNSTAKGLIGFVSSGTHTTNSFWDTQTTNKSTSASNPTGKTTSLMKNVDTFTNTATSTGLTTAWDFVGTQNNDVGTSDYWNIDADVNDGYPYLTWQEVNTTPSLGSLGPTAYANGSWGTDTTPTLEFYINEPDAGDQISYHIQIDDSSNFSSPVVDYTSGPTAPGSHNFFVGQNTGEGTNGVGAYTTGAAGQTLSDGPYYWRVKAVDDHGADSGYTSANSGSVAFGIDTTVPTTPGTPSVTTPTNDTTPSITWTASTDDGVGMHSSLPYDVQWSPSSDFTGLGTTSTSVSTNSYIIVGDLTEGTWYIRIRAWDNLGNGPVLSATRTIVVDTTNPTLSSSTPTDNAIGVGLTDNVVLTFSEAVNAGSGNLVIKRSADDTTFQTIAIGSGQVTGVGTTSVTINPSSSFVENTGYYVTIDSTALTDASGNSYSGISSATVLNFTTDELTDPIISSPEDNGSGNTLTIDYALNESILSGTLQLVLTGASIITVTLTDQTPGTHNVTLNLSNVSSSAGVLSSSSNSIPDDTYDITLKHRDTTDSMLLADSITSYKLDATAPSLGSRTPTVGATEVSAASNLTLTFNEDVVTASGSITVRSYSTNAAVETVNVAGPQVTGQGTGTLTVDLASDLDGATTYYVQIESGAIEDEFNNDYSGISDASWFFTTDGAGTGRVQLSASSLSVTEGGSKRIGIVLSEPIIGDSELTLNISQSPNGMITPSSDSVVIAAADWSKSGEFTFTAIDDNEVNGNRTVTLTLTAETDSGYYNGYTKGISITIIDNDTATEIPSTTTTTTTKTSTTNKTRDGISQTEVGSSNGESPSEEAKLLLNDFVEFTNGSGKQLDMKLAQVIYFKLKDKEHTATIKELGADFVVLTVASTPTDLRLSVGVPVKHDVNGDGKADIEFSLNNITGGSASITFKSISEKISQPVGKNDTAVGRATNTLFWVISGSFVGFILLLVIIGRNSSNNNKLNNGI